MWNWILQILLLVFFGLNISKADENPRATIKSLVVTSDIKYRYATTRVSAEYFNNFNSPVLADFHVTLPARAYISNFSMTVDGNVTYGVVKTKEKAKAIHQEAIDRGENTGYIEVKHRFTNVYDISVNVEPGKNIVFNLTYQELLQRSLGKYRHVIHLINKEIINNFLIEVFISEPQDIIDIQIPKIKSDELESPTQQTEELETATIEYFDNKNVYIRYNPSPEEQQRFGKDGIEGLFKVYYDVDRQDNPHMVYAVDGYFVHFFTPDSLPQLPKNIVFMLDVSGSMNLPKLEQLKQAMITILNSLVPDLDNFLIGSFSSNIRWMNDGVFVPATKINIANAINAVKELYANGGTNINDALLKSVEKLNSVQSFEKKDVLFFLTDGQPTVGVKNTKRIRKNVKEANYGSISFFMLGFGDNSNIKFLKEVATENGGFSRKIYIAADSQLQIEGLYEEITNILLKDIEITYLDESIDLQSLSPTNFSSYFKGSEIVTTGQLHSDGQEEMNIQMTMTNFYGTKTFDLKVKLADIENTIVGNNPNLTDLSSLSEITRNTWVFLTLKKLLKEDKTEENSEKIISLALRYGFVTPLTAMVVTEANLVGNVLEESTEKGYSHKPMVFQKHFSPFIPRRKLRFGMSRSYKVVPRVLLATSIQHTTTKRPFLITATTPSTNTTKVINFIPGIILEPYGCNETVCLRSHKSCLSHSKVILLADSHAYIFIYGILDRTSSSNCMNTLKRLVIKKKRKVLAQITPEMMEKNQKKVIIANKTEIILTVKKYLKLKVYIKTIDNEKALSAHFTVLQPLPKPKGILGMYMSNVTCQKTGSNNLLLNNKTKLYENVIYTSTDLDKKHCFINVS